jgi:hypothetical protein
MVKTESRVQSVSLAAVSVTLEPRPSSRPRPSIQVVIGIGATDTSLRVVVFVEHVALVDLQIAGTHEADLLRPAV